MIQLDKPLVLSIECRRRGRDLVAARSINYARAEVDGPPGLILDYVVRQLRAWADEIEGVLPDREESVAADAIRLGHAT